MFVYATLLAFAILLSVSLSQITEGFEHGWDQTEWPIYTGGCGQGGKPNPMTK